MFRDGLVRVITEEVFEKSVRLEDLIKNDKWQDAVRSSPMKDHYLSEMLYDDFISSEFSRVLSYRWKDKIHLDNCDVQDPSGLVSKCNGDVALSVLQTPTSGWKILWADALNHLNDPNGVGITIATMGNLYLKVRTLPQYFINGDLETLKEAINRGWMHQELAYGALDQSAVHSLIAMCSKAAPSKWRGNPFFETCFMTLQQIVSKRLRSVSKEVPEDTPIGQLIAAERSSWQGDSTYGLLVPRMLGYCAKVLDIKPNCHSGFAKDFSVEQCQTFLDQFVEEISGAQLSPDVETNMEMMKNDPSFCYSVIQAACKTDFWDTSDAYVAATAVVGAACGLDISDPLSEYKASFSNPGSEMPRNADYTMKYSHANLNLEKLGAIVDLLSKCWNTLNQKDLKLPYNFSIKNHSNRLIVDLKKIPPGMHTLGLGCITVPSGNIGGQRIRVNCNFVFEFSDDGTSYEVVNSASTEEEEGVQCNIISFRSHDDFENSSYLQCYREIVHDESSNKDDLPEENSSTTPAGASSNIDATTQPTVNSETVLPPIVLTPRSASSQQREVSDTSKPTQDNSSNSTKLPSVH